MAKSNIYIYLNGFEVRNYGGNASDVRYEQRRYLNMNKNDFLEAHPKWKNEIQVNGFHLSVGGTKNKYWE